jgi:hypothetical protein
MPVGIIKFGVEETEYLIIIIIIIIIIVIKSKKT